MNIYRWYPDPSLQMGGKQSFYQQIAQVRQGAYIEVAVVEAVFVLLFVVTLYYGVIICPILAAK